MKNLLGHIAIALFVVNNTLYDLIATYENTRLNIIFFSVMYLCLALFSINEHIRFSKRIELSFSMVMGIAFAVRVGLELTKWNMTFKQYMESINNFEKGLLFSFLLIALLLIPITNARRDSEIRGTNNE